MLNTRHRYHPFKSHPIIFKIKNYLDQENADETHYKFLKHNTIFMYPRILSFSLIPYPSLMNTYSLKDSSFIPYDGYPVDEFIKRRINIIPTEKDYYNFFNYLNSYFISSNFNPILILDLRLINVLYADLISIAQNFFKSSTFRLIYLCNKDIKNELDKIIKNDQINTFLDSNSLFLYLDELSRNKFYTINLPEEVTILKLGETFKNIDLEKNTRGFLTISLDFSKCRNISSFTCCLLCLYIRTISPKLGVRWRFDGISILNIEQKLLKLRMNKINEFFLEKKLLDQTELKKKEFRSFGIIIFDRSVRKELTDNINKFLNLAYNYFYSYLSENISYKFEIKDSSYKSQIRRMPRYNFLRELIHELIDNIFLHSNSVGYVFLEIANYHLYIFIGDCGRGLKKGILKNYDLSDKIKNDKDALNILFNLDEYYSFRNISTDFNDGAGTGLKMTLFNIARLNGKFIFRTGNAIGSFMNPIGVKSLKPSKIIDSYTNISGTQYCILIPLSDSSIGNLPATTKDFLDLEDM